jgi:hypothetical protein
VLAQVVVGLIREQSNRLNAQACEVKRAILDALRYNVPLDLHDSIGQHRHETSDGKKDYR